MPESVRLGMYTDGAAGDDLGAVCTAFAYDLTTAVHRGGAALAAAELSRIHDRYGKRLRLTRDVLRTLAERAVDETRAVFAAAGVRLDDLRLARQIATALLAAPNGETGDAPGDTRGTAPAPADERAPGPAAAEAAPDPVALPSREDVRAQVGGERAAASADVAGYDAAGVLLLALEAVLRGGPFDRACFHAADPVACEFRPRTGLGDGIDRLLAGPGVPFAAEHGPIGPALRRGAEVHVAHGMRLTLAESHLLRRLDAVSAALYPVRVGGMVIGCVHADRQTAFAAPEAATTRYVREVVATLERALESRRGAAIPAAPPPPRPVPGDAEAATMSVKVDAVLRVLRGEPLEVVAAAVGAPAATVATWRAEFLAGAAARLAGA